MALMVYNSQFGGSTQSPGPIPGKYGTWPDAKLRATPPPPPIQPQLSLARPFVPKAQPTGQGNAAQFDGSLTANIHPPKPTATVA